ncbi:flagellar biosynthetic protein FliO [Granulicella cerasi]|uniref:Flagellar biosynthetic protein FliO n=1 Tax=Granulicella cerasi TaxID=741063 RepID=A0ABW1Z4G7_9BACT|nr:flagellar biosynthetic protein FliO [Granulicella cerasi]
MSGDTWRATGVPGWIARGVEHLRDGARRRRDEREMKLLETLPLAGKKQLVLVAVGGQRYLVGVSDRVDAIVPVETMQEGMVEV